MAAGGPGRGGSVFKQSKIESSHKRSHDPSPYLSEGPMPVIGFVPSAGQREVLHILRRGVKSDPCPKDLPNFKEALSELLAEEAGN